MVFELHILAAGFSLPSIEPQCLATVAYLNYVVPRDEWILVMNSSLALSLDHGLPILKHHAGQIRGFGSIVRFLRHHSNGAWDLDAELGEHDRATVTAFSSYLDTTGRPLVDLSLFVSSENYSTITRPLISSQIPWTLGYSTTRRLRAEARARSAHLGITSFDVDPIDDDRSRSQDEEQKAGLPAIFSMRRSRMLLEQAQQAQRIRLDALTTSFLEPIHDLLDSKRFLLSDERPSSLDCLAFAYLALAYSPELPHPWFGETIRTKSRSLCHYVQTLRRMFLSDPAKPVSSEGAAKGACLASSKTAAAGSGGALHLQDQQGPTSIEAQSFATLSVLLKHTILSTPLLRRLHADMRFRSWFRDEAQANKTATSPSALFHPLLSKSIGFVTLIAGACVTSYWLLDPLLVFLRGRGRPARPNLDAMGEAGATLAILNDLPGRASSPYAT